MTQVRHLIKVRVVGEGTLPLTKTGADFRLANSLRDFGFTVLVQGIDYVSGV